MLLKPLPIGIENFEDMITNNYYYVDKTLMIKELIDKKGKINLFTRPRRFGKSLNMSMLRYYFEKTETDNSYLFNNLSIAEQGETYLSHMGQYPVISMTLKSAKQPNFDIAYDMLKRIIADEYIRHMYILDNSKLDVYKERYMLIATEKAGYTDYIDGIKFLSKCLYVYYNTKVIVLIDEYDVPLESAHFNNYYNKMVDFIRSLFENGLKSNDLLDFAVMTGCLRVSKESIFTGFNNPKIIGITSNEYGEFFGFTESEVNDALTYYGYANKIEEAKEWYNGYIFGETNVYNPWSTISYISDIYYANTHFPKPYWSNTSSNSIIRELITLADDTAKEEIEQLINGGTITKPIHEDIVYADITTDMDNLWNFLFFTGYLKKIDEKAIEETIYYEMKIPNSEVLYIYKRKIREWFDEKIKIADTSIILKAIIDKDTETLSDELNKRLFATISYFDSQEALYHGFLVGILSNIQGYIIKSNREAGIGRTDLFMKDKGINKRAMIFELKIVADKDDPEDKCNEALKQIETKQYAYDLEEEGYKNILKYGIAFRGKECMIRVM